MKRIALCLLAFVVCSIAIAQTNRFPPINLYTGDPTGQSCATANMLVQSSTTGGIYSCIGGVYTGSPIVPVPVAEGGTGSSTAAGALTNLGAEPSLGNPSVSGYILSSTNAGVRSWIARYSYTLPIATTSTLGGVKPDGTNCSVDGTTGVLTCKGTYILPAINLAASGSGGVTGLLPVANAGIGVSSTSQNYVFAGPASGSGAPGFRTLVSGDIPNNAANTTGNAATATSVPLPLCAGLDTGGVNDNTAVMQALINNWGTAPCTFPSGTIAFKLIQVPVLSAQIILGGSGPNGISSTLSGGTVFKNLDSYAPLFYIAPSASSTFNPMPIFNNIEIVGPTGDNSGIAAIVVGLTTQTSNGDAMGLHNVLIKGHRRGTWVNGSGNANISAYTTHASSTSVGASLNFWGGGSTNSELLSGILGVCYNSTGGDITTNSAFRFRDGRGIQIGFQDTGACPNRVGLGINSVVTATATNAPASGNTVVTLTTNNELGEVYQRHGIVSTNGTAATWVAGDKFVNVIAGMYLNINGSSYLIDTVTSTTALVLDTSAGVQMNQWYYTSPIYSLIPTQSLFGLDANTALNQSSLTVTNVTSTTVTGTVSGSVTGAPWSTAADYGWLADTVAAADVVEIQGNSEQVSGTLAGSSVVITSANVLKTTCSGTEGYYNNITSPVYALNGGTLVANCPELPYYGSSNTIVSNAPTAVAVASNVATVTATNSCVVGTFASVQGLTAAGNLWLNGQGGRVMAATSGSAVVFHVDHANQGSTADSNTTGSVTCGPWPYVATYWSGNVIGGTFPPAGTDVRNMLFDATNQRYAMSALMTACVPITYGGALPSGITLPWYKNACRIITNREGSATADTQWLLRRGVDGSYAWASLISSGQTFPSACTGTVQSGNSTLWWGTNGSAAQACPAGTGGQNTKFQFILTGSAITQLKCHSYAAGSSADSGVVTIYGVSEGTLGTATCTFGTTQDCSWTGTQAFTSGDMFSMNITGHVSTPTETLSYPVCSIAVQ